MSVKTKREAEFKTVQLQEVKVYEDQPGTFQGYLAVEGNVDKGDDVIVRGAFAKTIQESKAWATAHNKPFILPILWMHDKTKPLGGFVEMYEDDHGLFVKGVLDISFTGTHPNNPQAMVAYSGMKMGYADEMSVGYFVIKKEFKDGIRYLKELAAFEGSLATSNIAMNPLALVDMASVKTDTNDTTDSEDTQETEVKAMDPKNPKVPRDFNAVAKDRAASKSRRDMSDHMDNLQTALVEHVGKSASKDDMHEGIKACMKQFQDKIMDWADAAKDSGASDDMADNGSMYGWMTNKHEGAEVKTGRAISQENVERIQGAIANIKTGHDTLADLLDEYNVSNDNNNKTMHEPTNVTQPVVVEPIVQVTPVVVEEAKVVAEQEESQDDWMSELLEATKLVAIK